MDESRTPPPEGGHGGGRKPNTRLLMISAVLGGVLVLLVSAALNWPTSEGGSNDFGGSGTGDTGSSGTAPAGEQSSTPAPPPQFSAKAGTCLNWTEPDAGDMRKVTCAEPHLFEVTGKTELEAGPAAPYPSPERWQQLKQQRCTEVAVRYLGGNYDPNGQFQVNALTPGKKSWAAGDRTLHCVLQKLGPAGQLHRFTGSVKDLDQSDVYEVGTCLGISGTSVTGPVDCSEPHSVEITGVVDLGKKFPDGFPPIPEQDKFLATRCNEITAKYAGSPTAAEDKGLTVYWDNMQQQSWEAGSRRVNCKVSAQLPDGGGLAPITGSIKGEVTVGNEPAPEVSIKPGVPANGTR